MSKIKLTRIGEIMTTDVMSIDIHDTMAKVDGILKDKNIHHLPVLADDKVVGIVSKSDYLSILHGFSLFSNKGKEKYNRALLESCLVQDVMTRNIATVKATDSLDYAMGFFRENLFHALPVVNDEKHLVGIITTYDLLSYAYS